MPRKLTTQIACLLAGVALVGCSQKPSDEPTKPAEQENAAAETGGHNHGGWWCGEHGIPEEECSMCSSSAAQDFKDKGDWCDEHDRAESQCFVCEPARAEKFVELYKAKTGEDPPPRSQ